MGKVLAISALVFLAGCSAIRSGTFSNNFSSLSSKACEDSPNPAYRVSLLTKTEIGYVLADLYPSETTANANILNKVKELSEIGVDKLVDKTSFSENNAGTLASEVYLIQLLDVAQLLFDQYALSALINTECLNVAGSCLSNFLDNRVSRLWRRPLLAEEKALFTGIFSSTATLKEKLNQAFLLALSSPQFYLKNYLPESTNSTLVYDQFAFASRLSFFLFDSVPDAELWSDAAAGKLVNDSVVEFHVDRLLSKDTYLSRFVRHTLAPWIRIDRDLASTVSVTNDKGVSIGMKELAEQQYLKLRELVTDNKSIAKLISSDSLYMSKNIANYLGMDPTPYATTLQKVSTIPGKLEGSYLTSSHFAKSTTNDPNKTLVTDRGKSIVKDLLCGAIPVNELDPTVISQVLGPNASTMTQIEIGTIRTTNAACLGCHSQIDRMGMGVEFVDGFGRLRSVYPTGQNIQPPTDLATFLQSLSTDSRLHACFLKNTASKFTPVNLIDSNPCASEIYELNMNQGIRSYVKGLVNSKLFRFARSPS
jgi:hypothetical protein